MYKKAQPTLETLKEMIRKDMSRSEIGSLFNRTDKTVARWIADYGLSYDDIRLERFPSYLTQTQLEVLEGSLLGDGYLEKTKRAKNARFKFKQAKRNLDYVVGVRNDLQDFVTADIKKDKARAPTRIDGGKVSHRLEDWNGKWLHSRFFYTIYHSIFLEQYQRWYGSGMKRVPRDLKLTPRMVAHWLAQNGNNYVDKKNSQKSITLATNAFPYDDQVFLVQRLQDDIGIEATVSKSRPGQFSVRVRSRSYFKFINLMRPFLETYTCLHYKLDTTVSPRTEKGQGGMVQNLTWKRQTL